MKPRVITMFAALACALFAIALAPNAPSAIAGAAGHHAHDLDPEAQIWYDFAHDKAQEINLLHIRASHSVEHKTDYAVHHILNYCCTTRSIPCDESRYSAKRRSIARRARFDIGKCVWEAQMELDACYEDARQELEAAGYAYFVLHIYSPYRTTQRALVNHQRYAQQDIGSAVACSPPFNR